MLRLHVWMSTLFHKSRNGNITRSDLVRSCLTCLSQRSPNFMQAYTKLQHRDLGHCYLQRASPWAVVCAFVSWILQVTQVNKEQDCMENALNSYKEHYHSKWAMCECQIDEHNNGVHLTHTHRHTLNLFLHPHTCGLAASLFRSSASARTTTYAIRSCWSVSPTRGTTVIMNFKLKLNRTRKEDRKLSRGILSNKTEK